MSNLHEEYDEPENWWLVFFYGWTVLCWLATIIAVFAACVLGAVTFVAGWGWWK